jgi:hypothetical protein
MQALISNILILALMSSPLHAEERRPARPMTPEVDAAYQKIIEEERQEFLQDEFSEDLASGIAALIIGLYGYYNDNRGVATKMVYSATQTAGVLMISSTLGRLNRPSLLLTMDRQLRRNSNMSFPEYQRLVVKAREANDRASYQQIAYTSMILGGIYGYNAYREKEAQALRNVFAFLSLNFLVVSGVSFARMPAAPALALLPSLTHSDPLALRDYELQLRWSFDF